MSHGRWGQAVWAGALAFLLVAAPDATAQRTCEISMIRGATSPQGGTGTMRVINDGQPCGLVNYGVPATKQNPATVGSITRPPKHGKAELVDARVQYTPDPGYAGQDAFSYEAQTTDATGRPIVLRVHLTVTVLAAP